MIELLDELEAWTRRGVRSAVARVVRVDGSGPRLPGAAMAVSEHGEVIGSVSGGCVEGAVVAEALQVLAGGEPRLVTFGYSDDDAFAVGLTCGGTIHIFVEPFEGGDGGAEAEEIPAAGGAVTERATGRRATTEGVDRTGNERAVGADAEIFRVLAETTAARIPVALATVVEGPGVGRKLLVGPEPDPAGATGEAVPVIGSLGHVDLDRVVVRDARAELAAGRSGIRHLGTRGEARIDAVLSVFVESFAPPPRMIVIGAVDFTAALVRAAKLLSYRVTVCDARPVFATTKRFPDADEVVAEWPHRHIRSVRPALGPLDAVCVLSHDVKFDVPALLAALDTRIGYIGAMGSRRTHVEREERLREAGVDDAGLARIHSPIGLALGARTPEETAVAIAAEIVAGRYRGAGADVRSLRHGTGPIH